MTRHLLTLMIPLCAAWPAMAQTSEPKTPSPYEIYGRIDLSADHKQVSGASSTFSQTDNASRLGVRGGRILPNGMTALYGLEMGISTDSGSFTSPAFRNAYVGLHGRLGALALGRLDSANPTGSPLYSLVTRNVSFAAHDAGATAIGTSVLNARNRTSNSIGYSSPSIRGFVLRARYYTFANEGTQTTSSTGAVSATLPPTGLTEGSLKQHDVSVAYESGAFSAGIGYGADSTPSGVSATAFRNKTLATASYDFGVAKIYAALGQDRYLSTKTTRPTVAYQLVGIDVPFLDVHRVVLNVMRRDVQTDLAGTLDRKQLAYLYKLDKETMLFATWDAQNPNTNAASGKFRVLSAGAQYNF